MSEVEVILRQEAGVKDHESETPPTVGLKAGAFAELGTLILTNKRLIYISKGGGARAAAWALGGVFAAQAIENSVSKAEIDELSSQEGSYFTLLQNITRAEAGKKMGQTFVSVGSVGSMKPVHAYVVGGGTNNQQWAATINQAKAALQFTPTAGFGPQQPQRTSYVRTCQRCGKPDSLGSKFCTSCGAPFEQLQTQATFPSPPPPPPTTPTCPYCKSPIRYIQQYQRWYCDNEKRYV